MKNPVPQGQNPAYDLYLEHLKHCLTGALEPEGLFPISRPDAPLKRALYNLIRSRGLELARPWHVDSAEHEEGVGWPRNGLTMIGFRRLENIRYCAEQVLLHRVPGDFIETGVWRGGAAIFMKAVLAANGDSERRVWLADSFRGYPQSDTSPHPAEARRMLWSFQFLAVPVEAVRETFSRYGLLDDRVCFLEGWFKDTLPTLRDETFSVVRLDGDLYESTMDGLVNLYPLLSPGGYMIIDHFGNADRNLYPGCRQAVADYRSSHRITDPIHEIDWAGIYWGKT
jgi:O-methyltransferase